MNSKEFVIPYYKKLNNGINMPRVGYGTYKINNLDKLVYAAIQKGIHHIDTASLYENEADIGEGIRKALEDGIVKREDLFIATKLWHTDKNDIEKALKASLAKLNLDYIDLWLIHWPMPNYKKNNGIIEFGPSQYEVWRKMEEFVQQGLVKSLGVSNYGVQLLMDLLSFAKFKPVVNQIEYHPFLTQPNLIKFCQENEIAITAYNSLVKGVYNITDSFDLLKEPIIIQLAEKYSVTPGKIALNWAVCQEILVIPSTSKAERLIENSEILDFKMSDEDVKLVSSLNKNLRLNPSFPYEVFNNYDVFA